MISVLKEREDEHKSVTTLEKKRNRHVLGEGELLEVLGVRGREVGTGDTLDGGIEVVPSLGLGDLSGDLGPDTEHGETSLDGDKVVGLLDGLGER